MQQPQEDQQPHTTIEEVEQRLFAMGAMRGKDDPIVKKMLLDYSDGPAMTLEEIRDFLDKALGDESITEELDRIR